jgi:hypothetical protein
MTKISKKKRILASIIVISLLITVLLSATGCESLGLGGDTETTTPTNEPGTIDTAEEAELAVYQYLLAQAKSAEAKVYLADFYTICHNWDVQSEYFRDGSETWLVHVDMTGESNWEHKSYWQRAGWFVLKDGSVIPANLYQSNALRIEADLKELSAEAATE